MAEPYYLYPRRHGGNIYVQFRLDDDSLSYQKSTGTSNYNEAQKAELNVHCEARPGCKVAKGDCELRTQVELSV